MDDDAVLHKGYVRRFGIDITGGGSVASNVIAPLWAVEELRPQRAFDGLGRDAYLDCGGKPASRRQKCKGESNTNGDSVHGTKDKGNRGFSLSRGIHVFGCYSVLNMIRRLRSLRFFHLAVLAAA